MKQAQVLTKAQLKAVMSVTKNSGKHAERNCIAIALSYYAGLRVKEISCLTISDVFSEDGNGIR
ncbi:MAG: integrase/recombinase XerD [Colwellia sp.]|jgi:integrase/recombinase XerD